MSSGFKPCICNSSPTFSFEYFIRKDSFQTKEKMFISIGKISIEDFQTLKNLLEITEYEN